MVKCIRWTHLFEFNWPIKSSSGQLYQPRGVFSNADQELDCEVSRLCCLIVDTGEVLTEESYNGIDY